MKRTSFVGRHQFIAIVLLALVLLSSLPARAWELGLINTWIRGKRPLGGTATAHGGSFVLREELCRYSDVSLRAGYMRSDCFKTYYVPVEATVTAKYPFLEGRLVPFVGIGGGYHFFVRSNIDLDDSTALFPMLGVDWRWGKRKQWSLFIEGRYEFTASTIQSGPDAGKRARFDGPGGTWGIFYKF